MRGHKPVAKSCDFRVMLLFACLTFLLPARSAIRVAALLLGVVRPSAVGTACRLGPVSPRVTKQDNSQGDVLSLVKPSTLMPGIIIQAF